MATKGTAVNLPLSGNAPVKGIALDNTNMNYTGNLSANYTEANGSAGPFATGDWATPAAANYFGLRGNNSTKVPNIYADMSAVNAATINSLRQAFQIQKLIERDARGERGTWNWSKVTSGLRYPTIALSVRNFLVVDLIRS